ncbi:hypothetical protein MMC19_004820 [Ptychographa xylographoides]|nr:hypothetical protein [Ptychographa xylographoides]
MTIDDESMLSNFEETEREDPAPRKIVDDNRTVYMSRSFRFPKDGLWGHPVLCDFGEARIGRFHHGRVQNKLYRAPEVTFELEPGWSFGIDIWSTACMIWDIFENKFLFNGFDEESKYSLSHHIAEMAAFVGLPSPEYAQRSSDIMKKCFTPEGRWLGRGGVTVPSITLEDSEENLEGEDKALFLEFVRSMLQWAPEERKMAKQLLEHPWLTKNLNE